MADIVKKNERICFRPGNVRLYEISKYKENHLKEKGEEPTNTEIMLEALDTLLERENKEEIKTMEDILIKLILGKNRSECTGDKEYFNVLKAKINEFKSLFSS